MYLCRARLPSAVTHFSLPLGVRFCCRLVPCSGRYRPSLVSSPRNNWCFLIPAGHLILAPQVRLRSGFAVRPFTASAPLWEDAAKQASGRSGRSKESLGIAQRESRDDITDQIPDIKRPMGVIEGTSYTVLIIAGLAFAAAVVWAVVNELLIQPREYTCFNITLERLRDDSRVTVRLGTPVSGYGQESRNRQARQRIPHRTFVDQDGVEHTQVQFYARGPSGSARVSAEMFQDQNKQWQYAFLYVDVDSPVPQRVVLIEPRRR